MKLICLVAVFLALGSCKKAENNGGSIHVEQHLKVSFVSSEKKDILKEIGNSAISKMRLYYLSQGKKVLYDNPNLTDRYGIQLMEPNDQTKLYQLQLLLNNVGTIGENIGSTTYLDWENGKVDTIVGYFFNDENNHILTKFKFNNVEGGLKEKQGLVIVRE
ncbi:hypothetical protein DRF65_14110 [Chryseobacterium pennae]|uniref:Lipoprotein n=1 Tax=Chryseobacterium pennae TaxID=2258962 RepID=A0A3D9C8N5_9FLAO|nr:hypothetical protein [Chryseobacterium pennae]REC61862.1 hypothetical protein DRF65_14110 [Chryseobacterium pennae]